MTIGEGGWGGRDGDGEGESRKVTGRWSGGGGRREEERRKVRGDGHIVPRGRDWSVGLSDCLSS